MNKKNNILGNLNNIKKIPLLLGLFCSILTFAKSGNDHFYDMLYIFPFTTDSRNNAVFNLYEAINTYIDKPNGVSVSSRPKCIDDDEVFYNISFTNHRIWFHWGLSDFQNPSKSLAKSFNPLVKIVNDRIKDNDDRKRFWINLCNEEHIKLQDIYLKAIIAFGYDSNSVYDMQRKQIWAFVTILYCIHILGDHTTSEYKVIRSEEDLREDVYKSIRILAGFTNRQKGEALISYLQNKAPLSESGRGTFNCSAQKFLDAMKNKDNGFNQFILSCKGFGENYKTRFIKSGLIIE